MAGAESNNMYSAIETLVQDTRYFEHFKNDDLIPEPNDCAVCGRWAKGHHPMSWSKIAGIHTWVEPSNEVRLLRMKARRELRLRK